MSSLKTYERRKKAMLLLQVYAKRKRDFLDPGVKVKEIWRKIAREMKEKGSFDYNELYWQNKVGELRQDYERIKYIPASDGEMIDFKIAAENAFQSIENPVHPVAETSNVSSLKKYEKKKRNILLLQVYAKHKKEFLNPGVKKRDVWRKIAREMKEKGSFNYHESYWDDKVGELKRVYEKIKFVPASGKEMAEFKIAAKKAFQTIENPGTAILNEGNMASQKALKKEKLFERNITLLLIYTLHKSEFTFHVNPDSIWEKITEEMNEKFPNVKHRPSQCLHKVLTMKKQYETMKDKDSTEMKDIKDATFLKQAKLAFDTNIHPVTFMNNNKKEKILAPLKAFNMYKAQFSSPDANRQELWEKVTETANELSARSTPFNVPDFRNYLCSLKAKYDKLKKRKAAIAIPENAVFFEEANLVFEDNESEEISVNQILNDGLSEKSRQKFERNLALLRAYNIYKSEFSSPNEDDKSVWEKIAGTVRISCSLSLWPVNNCILHLHLLKERYKKKEPDWYIISQPEADIFLEEEKLAFGTTKCPEEHEQIDFLTETDIDNILRS